jgi:hypothetical protein
MLRSSLDTLKILLDQAKNYQLDTIEKNFFATGARGHYENPTTDVLAFFLSPDEPHNLNHIFLDALISCFPEAKKSSHSQDIISIRREVPVLTENHTYARIDLLIETTSTIYVIECKIYHHANDNPFELYKKHAQKLSPSKDTICCILSLNGESKTKHWHGISYRQLAKQLKQSLALETYNQPLNKWMIFAREFILLLESYYQMNIKTDNLNFILENAKAIEQLVRLREETLNSLPKYIGHEIQSHIGENFIYKVSDEHRNNTKEFWFANNKLAPENWSSATLEIENFNSAPKFKINIYLMIKDNLEPNVLKSKFPHFNFDQEPRTYQWGNNDYLKGTYNLSTLEISEVISICTTATEIITEVYVLHA